MKIVLATLLVLPLVLLDRADGPELTHGPFVGHVDVDEARIWARATRPGEITLIVRDEAGAPVSRVTAAARVEDDLCVTWRATRLGPDRRWTYELRAGDAVLAAGAGLSFRTAPDPSRPGVVRLAFGSCVNEFRFPRQPVWRAIARSGADVMVLLGDTPYIDTTDLAFQRLRYGHLFAVPELAQLFRSMPLYATWDDHDFGRNDTDGHLEGKERSRRAFLEYHANPSYGTGDVGIYTSFRRGPVEVFLLDTRWFAGVEDSTLAPGNTSLLGREQSAWLQARLVDSTAPFKVLACGMVWNGAVRPGKPDHWGAYAAERDALFRFLGEHRISGVLLVGGDIHRSRALRHDTRALAGYPLTELVTSPLANTIIAAADQPSPLLLHDAGSETSFLLLTADTRVSPATLDARVLDADERELFAVHLSAADLHR